MRISKVTTKTGDAGQTGLASGERVSKASARIAAIGDVDELNSLLGLIRQKIRQKFRADQSAVAATVASSGEMPQEIESLLQEIQNHLFVMGADLATAQPDAVDSNQRAIRRIAMSEVERLEEATEHYNSKLPPLKEFILPGGSEAGALLHLARTVARRAERIAVALMAVEKVNPPALIYLNRLSDLLFVLARYVNVVAGAPETGASFH